MQRDGQTDYPVDLEDLAQTIGIKVVWRPMVPEGVTTVTPEGICIYLQSNFRDVRSSRRERFTLAHEICHALFYEQLSTHPQLIAGTPSGATLEKLCQRGAGYLLVPTSKLSQQTNRQGPVSSLAAIRSLVERCDVSIDVVLRRLHEEGANISNDYGAFVVRYHGGEATIDSAACGLTLRAIGVVPTSGQLLHTWFTSKLRGFQEIAADTWVKEVGERRLVARRVSWSPHSDVIELRSEAGDSP
ncbi:MAG: ImmA/IrrE family metallo-endopeptidase [Bryobacteraceae bacterium]|nr:ImmA/IrrE family metallo-endopeptidase [Bryobacteraceae bacterium]